ncbi:hypothetical protein J2R96_000525 [Bradyrhizobium elkanii]|nr:hypothetical protein [Bradyrhizobium elkanii]
MSASSREVARLHCGNWAVRADPHHGRTSRGSLLRSFVGIDVANLKNAIAIAETSRGGEDRFFREVDASATGMRRAFKRTASRLLVCIAVRGWFD